MDIGKNLLGLRSHSERLRKDEFWALDGISFEVKRGEILGIIGPNGSGKTTLLKLLNGIFWPDKGKITIRGKVGALIEVGAGFHPMLTGRENIYVNAAILGMTKKEVDKKFDEIVEFADIGDFIDTPVKYYSSGMFVRLGFAVAVYCEPDILLVDEVLAVGDENFQRKCMQHIGQLVKNGTSVLLISHNMHLVGRICLNCLLLINGKLICNFPTNETLNEYYKLITILSPNHEKALITNPIDHEVKLETLSVYDEEGRERNVFDTGEKVVFKLRFKTTKPMYNAILHVGLNGDTYHAYNMKHDNVKIDVLDSHTEINLQVDFLGLSSGIYRLSVAIWDSDLINPYYWNWDVGKIEIRSSKNPLGRFVFKHNWSIKRSIG